MMKGKRVGNGDGTSKKRNPTTFEITLPSTLRQFLNLEDAAMMLTEQENETRVAKKGKLCNGNFIVLIIEVHLLSQEQ